MLDHDGRTLKTTRTSLEILELILEHDGLTLARLDRMLDKPKSSLLSHLNTLVDCRYVIKEGLSYAPSYRLTLIGERAGERYRLTPAVVETIDELESGTGEEANFTMHEYGRLLVVYGASGMGEQDGDTSFRMDYRLHNTAAGKALLAEFDRDRVERILDSWGMPQETEATITDRAELYAALDDVAERGYAVVDEEFAPGLVAVGATVHGPDGEVVGGLSVGGPKYRIDMEALHGELADQLLAAVESIEQESTVFA